MRTFIAIELDDSLRAKVDQACSRLRKLSPDTRWVHPDRMHLTLTFIGEVPDAKVPRVHDALDSIAKNQQAFTLNLAGSGVFGPLDTPKILWMGFSGDLTPLRSLQRQVADALKGMSIPPDYEVFEPHITLARARNPRGDKSLLACAAAIRTTVFGSWHCGEVGHFASQSDSDGMRYAALSKHALTGQAKP